jgi:hypothetical protein
MKLRTSRMETQGLEAGPQDGIPVVLVHGNLSTGHFPPIDAAERWSKTFFGFLASVEP